MKRKIGSTYFNDELVYDGNDLGAVYTKEKTKNEMYIAYYSSLKINPEL